MDENIVEEFFQILSSKKYANRKEYEYTIEELFAKYKINLSKTTMIRYYRSLINQNKIKFNPELEFYMRNNVSRSTSVVVITVLSNPDKPNCCPFDAYSNPINFAPIKQTPDNILVVSYPYP